MIVVLVVIAVLLAGILVRVGRIAAELERVRVTLETHSALRTDIAHDVLDSLLAREAQHEHDDDRAGVS